MATQTTYRFILGSIFKIWTKIFKNIENYRNILYRFSRIFPYITVRDRGGTAIYTSSSAIAMAHPKK